MTLTRAMRVLGATMLSGALLLTAAPGASADAVRDGQKWPNADFKLNDVWSITKGDGVTVAVIDDGVDVNQPDLAGQVLDGYDPGNLGRQKRSGGTEQHGTGIATLIAGHGHGPDHASGVVGLAPGVKILPIYEGTADNSDAVPQDIHWAVDNHAKVINISLGNPVKHDGTLDEAVAYAVKHDVLIVAGSGNDGSFVYSPANEAGVLAVGAVGEDSNGDITVWSKSNYGPEVLLTAPGVNIVSPAGCSHDYCQANGTSQATAYVSAAAALVRAKFPQLTAGQVANRLVKTAYLPDSVKGSSQLPDPRWGYGVIAPLSALTKQIEPGPAQGPLRAPTAAGDSSSDVPATAASGSDLSAGRSASSFPVIAVVLGGGLLLIILVVVAIVAVGRSRRRPPSGPAAPSGAGPAWPPVQQPYGNQPHQPGYPAQPPYPNPYQQGGNQQP